MNKMPIIAIGVASLLIIAQFTVFVGASISIGVKQGDWIEYNVDIWSTEVTGTNASLSADHNVTWARMEVSQIQGAKISLNIQTIYSTGEIITDNITLNLETGELGDDFIIPANLNAGDSFYDKHQGNITIIDIDERTVAGAQRTVISSNTAGTSYNWDQKTGILLSAQTTLNGYTMATTTNKTNLWGSFEATASPEGTPPSEPAFIYIIATILIIILVIVGLAIILQRRSGKKVKP